MRTTKISVKKEYSEYITEHILELLNFYEVNNIIKNKKTLEEMLLDVKSVKDNDELHKIAEHLDLLINFSELDYEYKHKIK